MLHWTRISNWRKIWEFYTVYPWAFGWNQPPKRRYNLLNNRKDAFAVDIMVSRPISIGISKQTLSKQVIWGGWAISNGAGDFTFKALNNLLIKLQILLVRTWILIYQTTLKYILFKKMTKDRCTLYFSKIYI